MIFYFTATGNCLYVAKKLDDDLRSIPIEIHKRDKVYKADRIGIICPTYGHEIPGMVKNFIRRSVFDTSYFYIIATYGYHHGGCAELTQKFLASVGKHADYINTVIMVDNALPGFDIEEQMRIDPEKKVDEHIAEIKADIETEKIYIQPATEIDREHHRVYLNRSGKIEVSESNPLYAVTEKCVGCGICTRVCPAGCIHLENGMAHHTYEGCTTCLACVHACPKYAIKMLMGEKNPNAHYRNPHISLQEIIKANNQEGAMQELL